MSQLRTALIDGVQSVLPEGVEIVRRSYQSTAKGYSSVDVPAATDISIDVEAGGKYALEARLYVDIDAGGLTVDFDGGTATATTFYMTAIAIDTTTAATARQVAVTSALATDINVADMAGGTVLLSLSGYIDAATTGTIVLRGSQDTSGVTTTTIKPGSYMTATKLN